MDLLSKTDRQFATCKCCIRSNRSRWYLRPRIPLGYLGVGRRPKNPQGVPERQAVQRCTNIGEFFAACFSESKRSYYLSVRQRAGFTPLLKRHQNQNEPFALFQLSHSLANDRAF